MSQIHYLPLTPGFFAILVGIFVIVLILRSVRYAYESLGVSSGAADVCRRASAGARAVRESDAS
jgi:hypothetical protein